MFPQVIEARHVRDFVVLLRFQDGVQGEVDLEPQLDGEVFQLLKNPQYFQQFRVDPELHTLVWPNGADFAPEFLHDRAQWQHNPYQTRAVRNSFVGNRSSG